MKSLTDFYTLSNGVNIPCVGLGTWQTPDGEVCVNSVIEAVKAGYRHIDTAAIYGNEEGVGEAIAKCGLPREELFITTKLWNTDHGYESTLNAFDESMKRLGLDYLDLYLIHWPNPIMFRDCWEQKNAESWRAMEELYSAGRIRAIGISNFCVRHMEALMKTAKITPMVNQISLSPGLTQDEIVDYCRAHNILPEAYSPLGTGKVFDVPEMAAFSKKYGKSIAQICLRWSLQMGYLPLPKSVTASRIAENAQIFDFELEESDLRTIATLTNGVVKAGDPDKMNF